MNVELKEKRELLEIISVADKALAEYSRIYNLNKLRITSALNLSYLEYRDILIDEVAKCNMTKNMKILRTKDGGIVTDSEEINFELNKLFEFLDNYYSFKTSKNFILDMIKIKNLVGENGLAELANVDLDACGDFFVDFYVGKKYAPMTLKFLKAEYEVYMPSLDKSFNSYNISLLTVKNNVVVNLWDCRFIPELYPRIYVDYEYDERCKNCKKKNIKDCIIKGIGIPVDVKMCLVGKRLAEECNVIRFRDLDSSLRLDVHAMLSVITHICRVYPHRNIVERKNSRIRKTYEKASIHIAKDNSSKTDVVLSLGLYYKEERREKKEWQGGHHSSPVEHERQKHLRRYRDKDGNITKIVEVKSTIVNRGNRKAVYKV